MKNSVTFGVPCKGRRLHIEQTLKKNIESLYSKKMVKWILLDYDCPDNLEKFVKSELINFVEDGTLKFVKLLDPSPFYRRSHAINILILLTETDFFSRVDADVFLNGEIISSCLERLENDSLIIPPLLEDPSIRGFIILPTELAKKAGGYDEDLDDGWGAEDTDFRKRIKVLSNKKPIKIEGLSSIPHEDALRVKFHKNKSREESCRYKLEISNEKIRASKFVANENSRWGEARVLINFTEERCIHYEN